MVSLGNTVLQYGGVQKVYTE